MGVHASLLTKEGTKEVNVTMMSISKDISARVVGLGGEDDEVEVVCADTPLPVKKSVALPTTGESTSVEVLWGKTSLTASLWQPMELRNSSFPLTYTETALPP